MGFFDPAYESLEKHRAKGTTTRLKQSDASSNEWFEIFKNERFPELFREFFRVLADNSHLYVLCDQETMFAIKPMGEAAGFKFWKPIVWDKLRIGMGYHYRARCEFVLFFEKGKRKLNNLGVPDVLGPFEEGPDLIGAQRIDRGYPTEKPEALLEVLVKQSSVEGEIVIDPFTGSGSTGAAAVRNGRRFLGNDLKERAVALATERLTAASNVQNG
jgi:site-specific DNA-methyltransferase (adenine-specific)